MIVPPRILQSQANRRHINLRLADRRWEYLRIRRFTALGRELHREFTGMCIMSYVFIFLFLLNSSPITDVNVSIVLSLNFLILMFCLIVYNYTNIKLSLLSNNQI